MNPYREPLNKAEEFIGLLEDGKVEPDLTMDQDAMIGMIRDLNHQYLELTERRERLKKHAEELREKLNVLEPFRPLEVNLHDVMGYRYMRVRFGRINVDYYRRLEKYLYEDLKAVFLEGVRNETMCTAAICGKCRCRQNGCDFHSLHFEKIPLSKEYIGTPAQACESLQQDIEHDGEQIESVDRAIAELIQSHAAQLLGAQRRLEELANISMYARWRRGWRMMRTRRTIISSAAGWAKMTWRPS